MLTVFKIPDGILTNSRVGIVSGGKGEEEEEAEEMEEEEKEQEGEVVAGSQ